MRRTRGLAAVVLVSAATWLTTACGPQTADYSAIWTTPTSPTETSVEDDPDARPVSLADYLAGVGVTGEQIPLNKLTDVKVTLPRPPGWTTYTNPNFSPGTEAIARNNTYPTAMVMVFKLSGNFDVPAALSHADDDAKLSTNFTQLNYSNDDFKGFPSAMIEGSYDQPGGRVHTYNRVVIPVTGAPEFQRYLVQFTVTGMADKAAEQAPEIQQVIDGFDVSVK